MTNLKTKASLLDALRHASTRSLTSSELEKQRVSFIIGTLKNESSITRAKVLELLRKQEGVRDQN